MHELYNNNEKKIQDAFDKCALHSRKIFIASPFFSNSKILKQYIERGVKLRIIVRSCEATNPDKLREIFELGKIHNNNVEMKFFHSREFHSKLYIFDNDSAILGSANLTGNGFDSNKELALIISDKCLINELKSNFDNYWKNSEETEDINEQTLSKYELTYNEAKENTNKDGHVSVDAAISKEFHKKKSYIINGKIDYHLFYMKVRKYVQDFSGNNRLPTLNHKNEQRLPVPNSNIHSNYYKVDVFRSIEFEVIYRESRQEASAEIQFELSKSDRLRNKSRMEYVLKHYAEEIKQQTGEEVDYGSFPKKTIETGTMFRVYIKKKVTNLSDDVAEWMARSIVTMHNITGGSEKLHEEFEANNI